MCDDFSLPQTSWIALLSIAHRYDFSGVYKRAIQEIFHPPGAAQQQSQDHVMLLSMGERYHVSQEDLLPSLTALVMRPQSLTEDEVAYLSALAVSRLARAREDFVRETVGPGHTTFGVPSVPRADIARKIACRIWWNQQDGQTRARDSVPSKSARVFSFG